MSAPEAAARTRSGDGDELLTPEQVVKEYAIAGSVGTLANWRVAGRGPRFVKMPGKASHVRYRRADVRRFIDRHTVGTTDDPGE